MNKLIKWLLIILALLVMFLYQILGIIVIEPIGLIPEGVTIVYVRYNTKMKFMTSPDKMITDAGMEDSLITRLAVFTAIGELIEEKEVIRLPYSETLYELTK